MEKIRNLSIRRSFALYLSVAMILSFFCAVLVQGTAEQFQIHLYRKHLKEETYYEALEAYAVGGDLAPFAEMVAALEEARLDEYLAAFAGA